MAKDKERTLNPAAQQRKLEKTKALKKGKAEAQARKNEKLARRNPERLQRQVDDLKALEETGQIKPREKQTLDELERDLRAVKKAREALGDKAPHFGKERQPRREDGGGGGVLGKRRWDGERKDYGRYNQPNSGSETDESVKRIPMPRDTPPPIPRQFQRNNRREEGDHPQLRDLPPKPSAAVYEAKTTYESAPQIRDLHKEAVSRFVPNVVRKKQETIKGQGGLVEPEELDRLEKEGYGDGGGRGGLLRQPQAAPAPMARESPLPPSSAISEPFQPQHADNEIVAEAEAEAAEEARRLAEEEVRFQNEFKHVQMEEVEDEDL